MWFWISENLLRISDKEFTTKIIPSNILNWLDRP